VGPVILGHRLRREGPRHPRPDPSDPFGGLSLTHCGIRRSVIGFRRKRANPCQPVPTGAANRSRRCRPQGRNRVPIRATIRGGRRVGRCRPSREPTASPGFPPFHRALRAPFPEHVSPTERTQSQVSAPGVKLPKGEFRPFGTSPCATQALIALIGPTGRVGSRETVNPPIGNFETIPVFRLSSTTI
jgi:hypothetical protein